MHFEFENTGKVNKYISSLNFKCYADDISMNNFYEIDGKLNAFVDPGRKAAGSVAFEVPENAEEIEVEFKENSFPNKKIIFKVK